MNAKTEIRNFVEHYGRDGIDAIIEYLEENGYTVEFPDTNEEDTDE